MRSLISEMIIALTIIIQRKQNNIKYIPIPNVVEKRVSNQMFTWNPYLNGYTPIKVYTCNT